MKRLMTLLAIAALLATACVTQPTQPALTATQGAEILSELHAIRAALANSDSGKHADASATVRFKDPGTFSLGATSAPITLVEFADYQCPFCKKFHDTTFPEIKSKYIDTGKVRYVVRDLPLSFHEQALPAAIATRCAGAQGKFWPVFETLFAASGLSAASARDAALAAGADATAFDACVKNPAVSTSIDADIQEAARLGVDGTPGFIVARRSGDEFEGTLVLGAQPASVFSKKFDELLRAP
jgi:protein-disulfide isomerase